MTTEKRNKSIYWTTTAVIFLFEGVAPALTSNTELAVAGIRHLGYPDYFRTMLTVFKVAGAIVLILPMVKGRVKEWAYAGFGFTMVSAFISHWAVDGAGGQTFFPLVMLLILAISYLFYSRLYTVANSSRTIFKTHHHVVSGIPQ